MKKSIYSLFSIASSVFLLFSCGNSRLIDRSSSNIEDSISDIDDGSSSNQTSDDTDYNPGSHIHQYHVEIIAPTCTEQGYMYYTCECGYNFIDDYKDPLGHDLVRIDKKEATCTQQGYYEHDACTRCDYVGEYQTIPANGHRYVNGVCNVCGEKMPSEGFEYTLMDDYYILSGIGKVTDKDLIIPSTHEGLPVIGIGESAFEGCSFIESIYLPESIQFISYRAFYDCYNLESLTINGGLAFEDTTLSYCEALKYIHIPDIDTWLRCTFLDGEANPLYHNAKLYVDNVLVTELVLSEEQVSVSDYAFAGYTSLTKVVFNETLQSIGKYAFYECKGLTSVVIPDSVLELGVYAFFRCSNLVSVTIGNGLTVIKPYTFSECSSLSNLTIGNNVTSIESYAFDNCVSLPNIDIPNTVTSIGSYAYHNCCLATSISLSSNLRRIADFAFINCSSVTTLTIPDNIVRIGSYAFTYNDLQDVVFEITSGWKIGRDEVDSAALSNTKTAAELLLNSLENVWTCSN